MSRRLIPILAVLGALALPGVVSAAPLSWSGAVNIDGATALTDVSCPSTSLCVAVDSAQFSNALASDDPTGGAGTWRTDPIGQNSFQSLNSVSCPSVSLCVAVDNVGWIYWSTDPAAGVWTDTGGSINGGGTLRDISCPTISLCVAGGNAGNIVWATNPTGGPTAWTQTNIAGSNLVLAVDCPTVALCVATDDLGEGFTSTNPTGGALAWTSTTLSVDLVRGLSCATITLCVAGDDGGQVISSTNPTGGFAAWTGANVAGVAFVQSVACPSAALCVAASSAARVYEATNPTGGAAAWSPTILASTVRGLDCPSTELCVGVGSSGNAFFGTQGTLTVSLAGTGTGSVAGSGIACPGTCALTYPGNTSVTLTPTPVAGSTFTGWSGACTGTAGCTTTMAASRAVTATFTQDQAPAPSGPAPAPTGTASTTPEPTPLPPPVVAQSANAIPVKPGVLVKLPGTTKFVPLASPEQIQFGAVIDARKGRVRLVIANGKGGTDAADFYEGVFRIVQRRAAVPIAELVLVGGSFRRCPKLTARRAGLARRRQQQGKSVRHLWGEGSGAFRTKGRYASATIRGTRWLTDDRCNGTLARVTAGSVTVRDLVKRRSVVVRSPRSYFAAARPA